MPRVNLIQIRGGTAADWTSTNPVLALREPGLETDTRKIKYGDGSTAWNSLPYASGGDDHFKGAYPDDTALTTAHPTAVSGDYAYVDAGVGNPVELWIWDDDDSEWIQSGTGGLGTVESVTGDGVDNTDPDNPIVNVNTVLRESRTVTTADAIEQTDDNTTIYFNSATGFKFTLDQLTADSKAKCVNIGEGTVQFINGAGVTLVGPTTLGKGEKADIFYFSATSPQVKVTPARRASPLGVFFTDDFVRANGTPGANYTVNVTTGTINITSNKLHFVGPAGAGFGDYVSYDGLVSAIREGSLVEVEYIAQNVNSTSYGLFIGLKSTGGLNPVNLSVLIIQTSVNNGKIDVYRDITRFEIQSAVNTGFTISAGDRIRASVRFNEFGVNVGLLNLTTGFENNMAVNLGLSITKTMPNTFKFALGSVGGTQDVDKFGITRAALKNCNICFVGNSIVQGYGARITSSPWVVKLMSGSRKTYTSISAQSGRTEDFLQIEDEIISINADVYVLGELMGNDISTGVSSGTWQANYATIVNAIKAIGKRVIHVAPVPRNTDDMSGGLSHLNSNYSADLIIDAYTPLLGSGTNINIVYGSGDNSHPGDIGHAKIAELAQAAYPEFTS